MVRQLKKGVGFVGKEVKRLIGKLSDAEWAQFIGKVADDAKREFLERARKGVQACGNRCDWYKISGEYRTISKKKGNFSYPRQNLTEFEVEIIGQGWVGDNFTTSSNGQVLISADQLKKYRRPHDKSNTGFYQANLEWRSDVADNWINDAKGGGGNAHIDVIR